MSKKIKNGIVLAGGQGSRLAPLTNIINKHLLGVNGKFIIDYPINTMKSMGVENLTVVLGGPHFSQIVGYLQDGSRYGLNINFVFQGDAKGIAHAISLCKKQVADEDKFVCCLGDNLFSEPISWSLHSDNAQIVLHKHSELNRFGVASIENNKIINIEEKPLVLNHNYDNYAITGCYLFDQEYFEYFKEIKPSQRGEFEVTEIINKYNINNKLGWTMVDGLWHDLGTHESIAFINDYFYNKKVRDLI